MVAVVVVCRSDATAVFERGNGEDSLTVGGIREGEAGGVIALCPANSSSGFKVRMDHGSAPILKQSLMSQQTFSL